MWEQNKDKKCLDKLQKLSLPKIDILHTKEQSTQAQQYRKTFDASAS